MNAGLRGSARTPGVLHTKSKEKLLGGGFEELEAGKGIALTSAPSAESDFTFTYFLY